MGVCPTSPHVLCGSGEGIRTVSLVSILWGCSTSMGSGAFAKGCFGLCTTEQELGSALPAVSQTCSQYMLDSGRVALLSPVLFIIFMDRISRYVARGRRESGWSCPLRVGGEVLPQVEEFKYLGVLFTSEGKMEREIDRRIGAASAVMRSVYRTVVVKKELSRKAKLSIYWSIYTFPTLHLWS
ncbi:hypothetical protein L3Q82_016218 [Scortum barcoo]|uniref:Uncharacterized protein n=1 Tax=Scortum barcoo TaxID=214431 RepID=A0ACB8VQN3_9TELE|nr:hypothetical protein L3Q82_016218 [Scortum barcoo]